MGLSLRRHGWSVGAGVSVLLAYVVVLSSMPKQVFWSPDEGGKFLELRSIQWHGGLTYAIPYAGERIDPGFRFYPHHDTPYNDPFPYPATDAKGTVRFHWPIWFPLLSGLMLRAFGLAGIYVIPLLSGWLIALLSGWILHALKRRFVPLVILLVGFATPVCFFSQCFWEHTLATLFGLLAVAILVAADPGAPGALLAMTPALIAAMMLRLEMMAFAAAAFLAWGLSGVVSRAGPSVETGAGPAAATPPARRSGKTYLLLAGLAVVAFLAVADTATARHQRFLSMLPAQIGDALRKLPHLPRSVASMFVTTHHGEGPTLHPAWVILTCLAIGGCFIAPFVAAAGIEAAVIIPALVVMLTCGAWGVFLPEEYRALHGIFPVAPFMVIWLYTLPDAWQRRDRPLLTLTGFAVLYLITGCAAIFAFYVDAQGGLLTGLEWGQRYLLTLYPMLTILSLAALDGYWQSTRPAALKTAFTVLVSALMLIGAQQEIRGIEMLKANKVRFSAWDRILSGDGPVVTDLWWLPVTLAPLFVAKEMAYVQSPAELAGWARLAAAQRISGFTFASLLPIKDATLANAGVRRVAQESRQLFGLYLTQLDLVAPAGSPTGP